MSLRRFMIEAKRAGAVLLAVFVLLGISQAKPPTIEEISKSPFILNAQISPSGKYFAAQLADDPKTAFGVFEWRDGGLNPLIQAQETDDLFIEWFEWVNDDTLLVRMGRLGGITASVEVAGKYERYPTRYGSSLYIFNAGVYKDGAAKPLWLLSDDGSMISKLPSDPDHILVQKALGPGSPRVFRVNVREDKKWEMVQPRIRDITQWRADRAGNVRIGFGYDHKDDRILLARAAGEKEFRDLSRLVDDLDKEFRPYAFAEELNQLYVGSNHETDTLSLYLFDVTSERFVRQIYHNPSFDVSGVFVNTETGSLQGVTFEAEESETIWFDEDYKREINSLKQVFGGKDVDIISFSDDAQYGIVSVSAPDFPGQYYIYDRAQNYLKALPEQHAALRPDMVGHQFTASYAARDGETIPAYVTLPPGFNSLETAKNVPFIIMPHGGPAARDFAEFDIWAQFYAMHGYGVLQMNFRGSAGYGLSFEIAGRRQWGELMQDDITDGVYWLVDKGIADPERIAIVGGSYGGYAALMGAVKTPELFQCAVSFAGVSNLFSLVTGAKKDSYIWRAIGDRFKDAGDLRENSPFSRVEDFGIPVLLIHGRLDWVVSYGQSESLEESLRRAGKPVEFVTLPKSGHGFYYDHDDRMLFFKSQKEYIHKCLGKEL